MAAFVDDLVLGIGFQLVTSWLFPRAKPKPPPEDQPTLNSGAKMYAVWGTSYCPTVVLYSLPANLAGHDTDRTSFGVYGLCNADTTCDLAAVRVNNIIIASKTPLVPLNATPKQFRQEFTTDGAGLKYYNDIGTVRYQLFANVANPAFGLLGYPGLQYRNLAWFSMQGANREQLGGASSRSTLFYSNRVSAITGQAYNVTFANPVSIKTSIIRNGGIFQGTTTLTTIDTLPSGFFGARAFRGFEQGVSADYDLYGISGGSELMIYSGVPPYTTITFENDGPIIPGGAAGTQGNFTANPLPLASATTIVSTNKVLVSRKGQPVTEITLGSAQQAPFSNVGTSLRDRNNVAIGTIPAGTKVVGWNSKMFTNDAFFPVAATWANTSLPPSGTSNDKSSTLRVIIEDLYKTQYPDAQVFLVGADTTVRGFTSTLDNVGQSIVDLATAFGYYVYERPDGNLTLQRYPAAPVTPADFALIRRVSLYEFLSEPETTFTPTDQQPSLIEFTYRDYQSQFAEKTVKVGYNSIANDTTSQRLDLVLTVDEAKRVAWTILLLQSQTNISVRFRIEDIGNIRKGGLIELQLDVGSNYNYWVVADIEAGRDGSFLISVVNWVPLATLLTSGFSGYMTASGDTNPANATSYPPVPIIPASAVVPAEPTNSVPQTTLYNPGWLFFSSVTETYNGGRAPNLLPLRQVSGNAVGGRFYGYVETIIWIGNKTDYGIEKLVLRAIGGTLPTTDTLVRVGDSWVSGFPVQDPSEPTRYTFDRRTSVGLYGSSPTFVVNEPAYYIDPNQHLYGPEAIGNVAYSAVAQGRLSGIVGVDSSYGAITASAPFGRPWAGFTIRQIGANYSAGILQLFISAPGANASGGDGGHKVNNFWDAPGAIVHPLPEYWISVNSGAYSLLGSAPSVLPVILEFPISIPNGANCKIATLRAGVAPGWGSDIFAFKVA
jgi:hypothetical protein